MHEVILRNAYKREEGSKHSVYYSVAIDDADKVATYHFITNEVFSRFLVIFSE